MANVVATEEPETAAKIMQVSTQVMGRPPCTPPTSDLAKFTRRREMPPVSMRLPARMKKGMAASGNLSMAENISLGTRMSWLLSKIARPRMAEPPMATAMEMLKAKHTSMVTSRVKGMVAFRRMGREGMATWDVRRHCAVLSSSCCGSAWCATVASRPSRAPTGMAA
ncbi:hypothetical protein FQZ97_678920 [compost metagenome]